MPGSWHDSHANRKPTFIHPPHPLHIADKTSLFSPPGKAILTSSHQAPLTNTCLFPS